jgi:site-specific recombinase XerD
LGKRVEVGAERPLIRGPVSLQVPAAEAAWGQARANAIQARLKVSCHQLRHTMATQFLNADAALVTIQDLLGHTRIKTTQRYCRVSNLKVQRDYHRAMAAIMQITG